MPHTTAASSASRFHRFRLAAVVSLVALVASLTVGLPDTAGAVGHLVIGFEVSTGTVVEGDYGTVTIDLNVMTYEETAPDQPVAPEQDIDFTWRTADDNATNAATLDEDYVEASGSGTIKGIDTAGTDATGKTTITIENADGDLVNRDKEIELDETFLVELSHPDADPSNDTATVTIENDDPKISIVDANVVEGHTAAVTVSLTTPMPADGGDVEVEWATAGGTDTGDDYTAATVGDDYTETGGTAIIPAGQQSATVFVDTIGDEEIENDETFLVELSSPTRNDVFDGDLTATVAILEHEQRVLIDDAEVVEGHEDTSNMLFTLRVDPPADESVTVDYDTSQATSIGEDENAATEPATEGTTGDVQEGDDYLGASGTVSIDPGSEAQVLVKVLGDLDGAHGNHLPEPDEFFFVDLTNVSGPASLPLGAAVGTILDDDGLPEISILDTSMDEGAPGDETPMSFTVKLSEPSGGDITLEYATEDDIAEDGRPSWDPEQLYSTEDRDFESVPVTEDAEGAQEPNDGRFTVPAGTTEVTVPVTVFGDDKHEQDETFLVELQDPDDVDNPPFTFPEDGEGADGVAVGTIVNDDPIPTLTVADASAAEGDAGEGPFLEFLLRLSNPTYRDVEVDFTTRDGSATTADGDYQQTDGRATIQGSPGVEHHTVLSVAVPVEGDDAPEPNETLHLDLSNALNATFPDGAVETSGAGTILNDDGPHLKIDDVDVVEGDEGTTDATFTVTLHEGDGDVTVDWATTDGTATAGENYTAADGTLTVPDDADGATVTVDVTGNTAPEPDRTFFVDLSNADGATVFDRRGKATIVDDDAGRPIVKVAADGPGTEGSPVAFDASDSTDEDGQIVGYRWDFGDGSDPVDTSGPTTEHVFGNDGTYQVTVTATDDDGDTGTGRLTVEVANAAPTATAGDDVTVEVHDPATLAGDATDPGDDELTFTWDPGDGADPVTGRSATHTYTSAGEHTATLTVTDVDGGEDTDTLTVRVQPDGGEVARVSGGSRIETAVEASRVGWPAPDDGTAAATDVVLATAWNYPDALAGGTVAALLDAPVLLTDTDALPDAVRGEIDRLGAQRVWILGGPAAVSDAVAADLQADGRQVFRFAGTDRFATAAKIARSTGTTADGEVALALGSHPDPARAWPDALSAGALAAVPDPLPVLLTGPDELPGATEQALADLDVQTVYVIGGTAAISAAVADRLTDLGYTVERLAGAHRYATSVATAAEAEARHSSDGAASVVFATGANFPDGLAAAPLAARQGGPVVLTPSDSVPDGTRTFLADRAHRLDDGTVLGGAAAVAETVREALRAAIVAQ